MSGEITFLSQPQNLTVGIGEDAFFPCTYSGTTTSPVWRIGDNTYTLRDLPVNHNFNNSGLIVAEVNSSNNGWAYSCHFTFFRREEYEWITIESTRGFLTVVNPSNSVATMGHSKFTFDTHN